MAALQWVKTNLFPSLSNNTAGGVGMRSRFLVTEIPSPSRVQRAHHRVCVELGQGEIEDEVPI